MSRPVSGILWSPHGDRWPSICAAYPEGARQRTSRRLSCGRAVRASCSTLLRMGFAEPSGSPRTLVRSYRTVSPSPVTGRPAHRRSLSVALSVRSPRPGSRQHPALWSPDFPRRCEHRRGHPADSPSAVQSTGGLRRAGHPLVDEGVVGGRLEGEAGPRPGGVRGADDDLRGAAAARSGPGSHTARRGRSRRASAHRRAPPG